MEIELQWDKMTTMERRIAVASYGQVIIGDRPNEVIYEMNIFDKRFTNEMSLPWDGEATIEERNGHEFLRIEGMSGPSGQLPIWSILMPLDVKIHMRVWSHEKAPEPAPVPEIVQHFNQLFKNYQEVNQKYQENSGHGAQGYMMDAEHAHILEQLGEYLKGDMYSENDHQACIDAMVTLGWVVHLISIEKLGELMAEWSY